MSKPILLFDFDGTINDILEHVQKVIEQTINDLGFGPVHAGHYKILRDEGIQALFDSIGIPLMHLPQFADKAKQELAKKAEHMFLIRGMREVLETLKKHGYTLVILSSNTKNLIADYLEKRELTIFDEIYCNEDIFGKDKEIKKYLRKHNLSHDSVIYVGDEIRDIEACKKVKVKIISVTWGLNSKEALEKFNPDYIVDRPQELLHTIQGITV